MSVTNYTLDKCKYIHSKLKNVLYLVSADHVKVVHIDTGEAYISGLTETPLRINGFDIQYSEETSLDERYKFDKKITLSMKGYVNYKLFGGRYYAIVEDNDGIYYMVNVDFPSKITHTFNLSQNVNQTDFTFHSLSNFPTLKLNSDFEADNLPCIGYNVYGIDSLQLIVNDYARLDTANKKVIATDVWRDIEFLGKSCSLQEVYDGEKVTDTISFQIPLNHKIGWSWNLLEFMDNRYASIIVPTGGTNRYFSGFNFGLEPSYEIASSSNNGESDIITVTLTEMSNYGLTAAVDYEDEDYDTTHWRYVKWVGEIKCYECVGYARARYLVQQEVDAFGNTTGNYKVKYGYQSQYQMLNVVGTFNNDEQFNDNDCAGEGCKLNTTIPSSIYFSAATCNTYTISASCDWNVSGLASYVSVTPSSGNADTQYSVTVCNSSSVMGQESTFNINCGSTVKVVNVILGSPSFINPTTVGIDCLEQDVMFSFDANCPITIISNPSELSYQITNSNLIVTVPRNNAESAITYYMTVQDCNGDTQLLTINQDKTYVKWVSSGYVCASGNSYVKEVKYTGATTSNYTPTSEYRQGALITSGDTRCQAIKKWEFVGHYYCINGDKYECIEELESYDGVNWTPTWETRLGNLVETDSDFCDETLNPVSYEWRLNYRKYQCEGDIPPTPSGYSNQYLTFVAIDSGKFTTPNNAYYSLDNGVTWTSIAASATTPTVSAGNKIMWKQTGNTFLGKFASTGRYNVEGNIMSLIGGDDFTGLTSLGYTWEFFSLFADSKVVSAENLVLPATTLTASCYREMFANCSLLSTAPQLPAATMADLCYCYMFQGCTSLTTSPVLSATTLADSCYSYMFYGCTSLTTVPELPATTLKNGCYSGMFWGCASLTTVPSNYLPVTTMKDYCYDGMFADCTSLISVPTLPATTLAEGCYQSMFNGCTRLTSVPSNYLPATTLAKNCYLGMFIGSQITTAPDLPATTLVEGCYANMFFDCTSLRYVKCLATDISASSCTYYWLTHVSSTGTFVKNSAMSSWTRGGSGIPSGWNVQNYDLNERWVNSGTTCSGSSGYDLYNMQAKEIYSGGNWTPTGEKRLGSLIEANSSQCGYVPPTPTSAFDSILTQFNSVLSANNVTQITSGGTPNTYNYLKSLNSEATSTFNNSNSELFKKSTYSEIYDYRTGSTTNHDRGLSAMTSWLMAMQISEIVANSGTSTNNQTKIFQKAYDIGGGRSAPVYGYSDLRSDVNICRLAASAIYAKNKSTYGFSQIDAMRTELGTSVNNRNTNWKDFGYGTSGAGNICDNTLSVQIGYACALNDIFPNAAGPYATRYYLNNSWCYPSNPTAADRTPDPLQPSNQFNSTTKNYIIDETIDSIVTNSYNLSINDTDLPRTVQAVADDTLNTEQLFGNTTYYKYNTLSPKYSFVAGSPSDNNGTFNGVFNQNVTDKDLSTLSSDDDAFGYFIHGVASMADNSRKTILDKQYGRRRPGQGVTDQTARCACNSGCNTNLNYLGDTSIERLMGTGTRRDTNGNVYYVDLNGNAVYDSGEPYYGETYQGTSNECAVLNATTYPSGHSSRIWGMALMLMGMMPSRWLEIYKAAYSFTVSRTIVRAHWNSDVMFGKLAATTFIPSVYSFNNATDYNFRTLYNNAMDEISDSGDEPYWNTSLPVVTINTPGGQPITSKEVWIEGASITIYQDRSTILYNSDALSIRGRGNSSWNDPKKPYALKLESKSEILGMASSKRWVLLSNYADRTLMRNTIASEIAQCTDLSTGMGWSPIGKYVELVLNGTHMGNYYLSEQIRVESNRLDLDDFSDCLYEIDRYEMSTDEYAFRSAIKNFPYHIKSPDAPDVTYFKGKIDTIETLLNNGSGYKPYLDYNSFADYWIVEELCQNFEARDSSVDPGSVWCYWVSDSGVGKLKMGPPWDFDYSTFNLYWPLKANGSYCSGTTVPSNGYMPETLIIGCKLYYEPLFNDSEFKAVVKQRWNAIKSRLDAIVNRFDYWYNTLNASEQLNWAMWQIPSTYEPGHHPDYNMTFLQAKNYAKQFYSARLAFMNNLINSF